MLGQLFTPLNLFLLGILALVIVFGWIALHGSKRQ